ncbi:enoyl-CoA hydratase/isomerase family protein [Pedobacter gandavensis]|uniref:Enoyl-CoA hydratase n=1 Tax=Pedobacter gandavensis TaxID=2679963 RepID=A0ABR6EZH7_9SPHI|nr:enoyl-CoA hydratase-related protein [Pedobacter gandavensis]MBB2150224.1 enoyl-CoA hydratase [Pedobacter gandavensis]
MAYQNLLSEIRESVLYVTINREQKLNALNKATLAELADVIAFAAKNEEVRAVLLTGAGPKAFVAGADISEFADYSGAEGEALAKNGQNQVFDAIENCPKPVVAAINGFALGGGLELAMACHIRIASENAKLGLPEVTLGLIPGYGGTQRLTQLVGKGKAIEMITTADMISAVEAEKIGLVNHVVPAEELLPKAEEILSKIKLRAPLAIASAISAVNAAIRYDENGFETEIKEFGKCFDTEDFKEGTSAFLEKRKAVFLGK